MTRSTIRAVLFDLGGVLLPFDRERRVAALTARFGCPAATARAFMALDLHRRLDLGEATELDLAAEFTAFFGVRVSPVEAIDLVTSAFETPNHELWELAARLRRRAVVGGFSDNPSLVVQMFPPDGFLEPMFFSSELRACKPAPEAFAAVEAGLGLPPAAILFIDDSPANVAAAIARGWDAIHFTGNAELTAELARRGLP
ncbi:MAG TPA: HAD family phosphatase [Caulobacteraceae bacterium]|nr:HAD family phosphatase [Caulobacteraceae bacterium]